MQEQVSSEDFKRAAERGLDYFRLHTTLVPGDFRNDVAVLEFMFTLLKSGRAVVADPEQLAVQSSQEPAPPQAPETPDEE